MDIITKTSTKITVRFVDLDAYAHVNNSVYLSYVEMARVDMLKEMFLRDMEANIQYLLIKISMVYKKPITLADNVIVDAWFKEVGSVKFQINYKIHDGAGRIYTTGYSVHALYDKNKSKLMRIPETWNSLREKVLSETSQKV